MFAVRSALVMALQPGVHHARFLETSSGDLEPVSIARLQIDACGKLEGMSERPEPDIDDVREALREHDDRVREDQEDEDEREEGQDGGQDDE
jgi:hypothetical protein